MSRVVPLCLLAIVTGCAERAAAPGRASPLAIVLTPHEGTTELDQDIRRQQDAVRAAGASARGALLDRLGWSYVHKARRSCDPGYYKLAELSALAILGEAPGEPGAMLLRGHVLQSLHRFAEAEPIARELIGSRGQAFDYGLLGDVLVDLGRVREALDAYQQMVDRKPCLQSYARLAHIRWLRGDVAGARQLMRMAAEAGSPRDAETFAWAYARLASYELQLGDVDAAGACADCALKADAEHPPSLLAKARVLQARGRIDDALACLRRAASRDPLPEYQWALADALRARGEAAEAEDVERRMRASGAKDDPRTFALFLASRSADATTALELANDELRARQDVHTHDAHAWALLAAGRAHDAEVAAAKALAEGTRDARLLYHAGAIALANGKHAQGRSWLEASLALRHSLLPLERQDAERRLRSL